MVNSMTAYSRCTLTTSWGSLSIEIQSVNRKHLEVVTSLPKEFAYFDPLIKKMVQEKIFRGKINLHISFNFNDSAEVFKMTPNIALAQQIKKGWEIISKELDLKKDNEGLIRLLTQESSLLQGEIEETLIENIKNDIASLVDKGLQSLLTMRKQEGLFLKSDFLKRIDSLMTSLEEVESFAKNNVILLQEKLRKRISELLHEVQIPLDDRLIKEIAILADKSDITEELTRIRSHIKLFKQLLEKNTQDVGKTLDFVVQELNREWNTVGAKCNDSEISHKVIMAKSECEKIREQVQNIE